MNRSKPTEPPASEVDEMQAEYDFDYRKARPNRFAAEVASGGRVIVLEPDVAKVFTTPEQVNSVLRALISTMPRAQTRRKTA